MWQIDRSMTKETKQVLIVFRVPVGRDSNAKIDVAGARCSACTVGEHHAGCSHILSAMSGLAFNLLQMGLIVAGDVGDAGKSWPPERNFNVTSAVPVQKIVDISKLLVDGGKLAKFTGWRPDAAPPTPSTLCGKLH